MEHIKTGNSALNTVLNYILDPVLSPIKTKEYARIKPNERYREEYNSILTEIAPYKKQAWEGLFTRLDASLTNAAAYYVYSLVRGEKPKIVLETGIFSGFSSAIILSALNKNRKGELYSTDVFQEVGLATHHVDKARWHKCIGKPESIFKETLREINGPIDIFLHDSHHDFKYMWYELSAALPRMNPNGYMLCDDAHCNDAFLKFCRVNGFKAEMIYSPAKPLGVIRLGLKKDE